MKNLTGKSIAVGVCGSISAYKSADLVRLLVKNGAEVSVIMTGSAAKFITPLTFEALTGKKVLIDIFDKEQKPFSYLDQAKSDLLLIAPATANTIAKIAHGIADNMLLNTLLAFKGDIVLAPAMNEAMYLNPSTVKNIEKIKHEGIYIVEPEKGGLACGVEGIGRLASLERIAQVVENRLINAKDLQGKKFIVTAGPTREYIDSMRFITNKSSGKMGYFIAEQLEERGAEVLLVSGLKTLNGNKIKTIYAENAERMEEQVLKNFPHFDCLIMAAAVADFKIKGKSGKKIKRDKNMALELQPTGDILKKVSRIKANDQIVIGFCAEDYDLIKNARLKLKNKKLDLIIANSISADSGPESDFNEVFMIDKSSRIEKIEKDHKQVIAAKIVDDIKQRFFRKKLSLLSLTK